MGIILRCARCNEMIWLNYYELPDKTVICQNCGERDRKQERQRKIDETFQSLSKQASNVLNKFVEKYQGKYSTEDRNKLLDLLEVKYQIHITLDDLNDVLYVIEKRIEETERIQSLEEFEKELLGKKEDIHKKIDAIIKEDVDTKYYCTVCNNLIDKKNFDYTKTHFGKPLCVTHQGTRYQRMLFEALKQRGIECEFEAYDGFKHIDIAIPKARLYLEIDGGHHSTDPTQLDKDLWRDEYSSKEGFQTIHYTNQQIAENLTAIADALVEVIKNRLKINSVIN
jgi:very-short-patch-repair endonuclease